MYLRTRNTNLSIERAIYEPATKDATGEILKPAVRTTLYIGSVKTYTPYAAVPSEILDKLTDDENAELKRALIANEPKPFQWLDGIARYLNFATQDIKACHAKHGVDETKRMLEDKVKAADEAWNVFFKTAQEHGLKRKRTGARAPKKVPPATA